MTDRTVLTSEEAGRLCKAKREKENLTLRDAADQIGMSYSALSRCENFKHELDAASLEKIARWLNVPLQRLQGEKFVYLEGEPLPQIVDVLIHRDEFLTPANRTALSQIFKSAYQSFTGHETQAYEPTKEYA